MRFERIRLHAMGPFRGSVDVDLGALEGQLVAVCGPNGAGKTTLLELLAGALYRECPTRGSLAGLAVARDAFVEVQAVNGQAFTVRQHVDNISGKGETVVLGPDGQALLKDTKVREWDKWRAAHIVSPDVLYSSSFSVQGRRGFLDLRPAERKDLLVEVLGLKRLDALADDARERARAGKAALDALQGRLVELPAPNLAALEQAVAAHGQRAGQLVEAVRGARVALDRARAAAGDAARQAELTEQRRAADRRLEAARRLVVELEQRLANNRAILERAAEIRDAVARAAVLTADVAQAVEAQRAADQALVAAGARETEVRTARTQAQQAIAAAQTRITRLELRLRDRDAVLQAAQDVTRLTAQATDISNDSDAVEARAARLEQLALTGKDQRIGVLRGALDLVRRDGDLDETGRALARYAADGLAVDDELAQRAAQAPEELRAVRARLVDLRDAMRRARDQMDTALRLSARAGEIAQAEADLAHARADDAAAQAQLVTATDAHDVALGERTAARRAVEDAAQAVADKRRDLAALDPVLALRPRLEQAEARIDELTAQAEPARAAVALGEAELATLPVIDAAAVVNVDAYERAVADADRAAQAGRDEQARAAAALERAQDACKARDALLAQVTAAEADLADWTRLAQDLGKDGLQAMEIDAALPEWTTIANHLLHSCLGPRFTVELRTDRLSADGKKVLEDLEARVIDTVNGRDADATTYSGGELVLVGSALSLGLTTLACRRAGVERPTICLDEAGAALDQDNGRAWIAMLRMAAKQIGADKVLYISHSAEAQDLADARIHIADGAVTID